MKKLSLYALGFAALALACVFALPLVAATDHDTSIFGRFVVQGTAYTEPTCATSSGDGDGCFAGDLEANGALDVAGAATLSTSVETPIMASALATIRFCGNGPDGATTTYMGPVLLDDTEADLAFGGAGCDGLDNTTEGTADAPWHAGFAYKPVAMACTGLCTGATAANDAIVFQLRDDAASVAGMTCTTAALGGDATPATCSVRDATPATVAAASAMAVSITMTNDDCNDAGDDFECLVFVTF